MDDLRVASRSQVVALAWDSEHGRHCIVGLSVGGADAAYCADRAKGGNPSGEPWVLVTIAAGHDLEIRLPRSIALQLAAALVDRAGE